MLQIRRLNLALLLVLILALLWPAPAAAHLDLERSEPADGAILETPPEVVRLWFNEELDTFESTVAVFDTNDRQVDSGDAQVSLEDRTLMQAGLPSDLPPGTYTVRWTATDDADGHPVEGELKFTITGTPPEEATGSVILQPVTLILAGTVGIVIVAGGWFFRRRHNKK